MYLKKDSTVYCLFEQSGTFKNAFKKLGFNAFDYDILDEFNYAINFIKEFIL